MTELATRDQILGADDLDFEDVYVERWKLTVRVKVMSATEYDAFQKSVIEMKGKDVQQNITNKRAKLLARCLCDKDGKRLFTEADIEALGRKSSVPLDQLIEVASRLNKMTTESVEELRKNSETQSTDLATV